MSYILVFIILLNNKVFFLDKIKKNSVFSLLELSIFVIAVYSPCISQ